MNCQEALDLLYEIIDKEASEIDTKRVKEHLDKCHKCLEVYRLEESVQDLIKEKVKQRPQEQRVEKLKSKILDRLDEIDEDDHRHRGGTSFFRISTRMLVAAASLVLLLGVALISAKFIRPSEDQYLPLEQAHLAVNDTMASYDDSEVTAQLISSIQSRHQYAVAPDVSEFHLVGGHIENVMGIDMPHLVYTNGSRVVSVFIVPSDSIQLSDDLQNSVREKNNIKFFDHRCHDCRLVFHKVGSATIITASTDQDYDLTDFVPGQLRAI